MCNLGSMFNSNNGDHIGNGSDVFFGQEVTIPSFFPPARRERERERKERERGRREGEREEKERERERRKRREHPSVRRMVSNDGYLGGGGRRLYSRRPKEGKRRRDENWPGERSNFTIEMPSSFAKAHSLAPFLPGTKQQAPTGL